MKKLFWIIALVCLSVVGYGQAVSSVTTDYAFEIGKNSTYLRYVGVAADTMGIADSTWTYTFKIKDRFDATKQAVRVELDEVSGTGRVVAALKGKDFWQDSWTSITSVTYYGGGSDTTFYLNNSTAKSYRFYAIDFDVAATTTQQLKLTEFEFSLYK